MQQNVLKAENMRRSILLETWLFFLLRNARHVWYIEKQNTFG